METLRMKITVLGMIFLFLIFTIACFEFLSIDQPESVQPGEKINVYLEVQTETEYDDQNPHYGILGLMMPLDWQVDSVYYEGDYGSGYCTFLHPDSVDAEPDGKVNYWTDSLTYRFPPPEGMHWVVYQATQGHYATKDPMYKYLDVYVDFTAGQKGGEYDMGYFISTAAYELEDSTWYAISLENNLTVNNTPPFVDLPDSVIFENDTSVTINLWDYTTDGENEDAELSFDINTNGRFLTMDYDSTSGDLTLSAPGYTFVAELYVTAADLGGEAAGDTAIVQVNEATAIGDVSAAIPLRNALYKNYPNPFNPRTSIRFDLKKAADVRIEIFNELGQKVNTLVDGYRSAGTYTIRFDARALSSGVYYYKMTTPEFKQIRKMLLIK